MVHEPDISNQDLEYLESFLAKATEMEAGLRQAEQNLEAVRIHISARKLVAELGTNR